MLLRDQAVGHPCAAHSLVVLRGNPRFSMAPDLPVRPCQNVCRDRPAVRFAAGRHLEGQSCRSLLAQFFLERCHGPLPGRAGVLKKVLRGKRHCGLNHRGFVIGLTCLALRHGLQAVELPGQGCSSYEPAATASNAVTTSMRMNGGNGGNRWVCAGPTRGSAVPAAQHFSWRGLAVRLHQRTSHTNAANMSNAAFDGSRLECGGNGASA